MNEELENKDRTIEERGMLYYLWKWTDFLVDLPEWMIPHIERETGIPNDPQMGEPTEYDQVWPTKSQSADLELATTEEQLMCIITEEFQGIPEVIFCGTEEEARGAWITSIEESGIKDSRHYENECEFSRTRDDEPITYQEGFDYQFWGQGDHIWRVDFKMVQTGQKQVKKVTDEANRLHTVIYTYSGIPEVAYAGDEQGAKAFWKEAMDEIAKARKERAERNGEDVDLSCDFTEATTEDSWDTAYFCNHKTEWKVDWMFVDFPLYKEVTE